MIVRTQKGGGAVDVCKVNARTSTRMQNRERIDRIFRAAEGRWPQIFEAAGMNSRHFAKPNRPCPLCGGTDRFTFLSKREPDHGMWFCRGCGAGDGIRLVRSFRHATFFETLEFIESFLGLPSRNAAPSPGAAREERRAQREARDAEAAKRRRRAALEAHWNEAESIDLDADTPAARYLRRRGIRHLDGCTELRWFSREPYWSDEGTSVWSALLARVTDPEGRMTALHRTYLTESGEKAPVAAAKKLTAGELGEGFVRLFPPSSILCLAEGIETALSVHETEGVPVWSVISVSGYESFRTLPDGVRELRIYADNDRSFAGIAGAYELARRLKRDHPTLAVRVFEPEREGEDWNDVLRRREEEDAPKQNRREKK